MAEMAPARRISGQRAVQAVVTPAEVLADADLSPADGILLVPGHHQLPGGVGEYAVAPIVAGDQRQGWLVAVHRTGPLLWGAGGVLERAAVVAALSVIRQQAVHSVELRFQGDLVRRLVAGSLRHTERVLAQTRSFGWRLDGPVVVLVTATETAADPTADPTRALDVLDRLADGWRSALEGEVAGAAVAGLSTEIVTVLPLDGRSPEEISSLVAAVTSRVNARVRRVGRVLATGIGRPAGSLSALGEAYQQAQRALSVGQEIHGPATVTHFDQLGVFRLLSLIPDSTELRTYVDEVLGVAGRRDRPRLRRPAGDAAGAAGDEPQRRRVGPPAALPLQHDAVPDRQAGAAARPLHHRPDAAAEPAAGPARGPHARPGPAAPPAGGRRAAAAGRRSGPADLTEAVDALVARMEELLAPMEAAADPARFFLGTYLRTTRAVGAAIDAGLFEDPAWVCAWDVDFAGLYLDALEAHRRDPASAPEPWRQAFGTRAGARPEAHVLLGMNAHINFDLPQSLVRVIPAGDFADPAVPGAARARPRADRRRPRRPGRRRGRGAAGRGQPADRRRPVGGRPQPRRGAGAAARVAAQGLGERGRAARRPAARTRGAGRAGGGAGGG